MTDKKYLAAFDVGGTKTDAVLFTKDGHITARVKAAGGIPLDIGLETAADNYVAILKELFAYAEDGEVATLYGSVATTEYFDNGKQLPEIISKSIKPIKMRIEGDGPCLISGMLGHVDGASMICGTGSSLYFRKGDEYSHTGGWGYLIDSCGSGYVLGRYAIQAAVRAHDGRAEPTILCELLEKKCGMPIWDNFIEIYEKGRAYIASFASCVFEGRRLGDPVATRIFNLCAQELGDVAFSAYRQMGKPFDLVFNGGIFTNYPEYAEAVKAACPQQLNIIYSNVPPIYGCAVEALYDFGIHADEQFRKNFMEDYNALTKGKAGK